MQKVEWVTLVEGSYDGKTYRGGRILVGTYDKGKCPKYVKMHKCSAQLAENLLASSLPISNVELLYDGFQNIAEIRPIKG